MSGLLQIAELAEHGGYRQTILGWGRRELLMRLRAGRENWTCAAWFYICRLCDGI
jgi:hypothetical protein